MNAVSSGNNKLWRPSATNDISIISNKAVAYSNNKVWQPPTVKVKFSEEIQEYLETTYRAFLLDPIKIR